MSSKSALSFDGTLDISRCNDAHRTIISSFDEDSSASPTEIDLSQLDSIDTAGIQLLLSLIITENKKSTAITLNGLNDEIKHNINMLGLDAHLQSS